MNQLIRLSRRVERRAIANVAMSIASLLAGLLIGYLTLPQGEGFRAGAQGRTGAPFAAEEAGQGELSYVDYWNQVGEGLGSD